jgi:hypothetical protein
MSPLRYMLDPNADGTWNVLDLSVGGAAEMHGQFLNRVSRELAEELMSLLNKKEERHAAFPQKPLIAD